MENYKLATLITLIALMLVLIHYHVDTSVMAFRRAARCANVTVHRSASMALWGSIVTRLYTASPGILNYHRVEIYLCYEISDRVITCHPFSRDDRKRFSLAIKMEEFYLQIFIFIDKSRIFTRYAGNSKVHAINYIVIHRWHERVYKMSDKVFFLRIF